jgi:hypothetical protein
MQLECHGILLPSSNSQIDKDGQQVQPDIQKSCNPAALKHHHSQLLCSLLQLFNHEGSYLTFGNG